MNKAIIWILVVVIVVVGIVLLSGGKSTPEETMMPTDGTTPSDSITLKPATGNIDETVASILVEASADSEAPTETDISLTTEEDWNGLDQTLDTSNVQ